MRMGIKCSCRVTLLHTLHCVDVDLTLDSFPADFEDRRVIYWHGVDNDNRKICKYIGSALLDICSRFRYSLWTLDCENMELLCG